MRLGQFLDKQALDVIQWNEPEPDILAYRCPMLDMAIKTGARLAVRESELAVFVDQGRIAAVFGPGVYTLTAVNLPLLAELESRHAGFESPFETDLYFFSTHLVNDQKWGTSTLTDPGDNESVAKRLRSYGIYSYRLTDPRTFFGQVSGTRESYSVYDLDDRLRNIIVGRMIDAVAASGLCSLDLIASRAALNNNVADQVKPALAALGLELTEFSVENVSIPSDLQGSFDQPNGLIIGALSSFIDTKSCTDCSRCGGPLRSDGGIFKCDFCHNVLAPQAVNDTGWAAAEIGGRDCPFCSIELMQATIGSALLLYCTRCDGMLVAMEQLERLISASRSLPGGPIPELPSNSADQKQHVACPQCRRRMEAHSYDGHGDVEIDTCERCSLNWLDHGALARIAHPPVSDFVAESNASDCSNDGDSYFAGHQAAQVVEHNNL